jgi:hypothetical protein
MENEAPNDSALTELIRSEQDLDSRPLFDAFLDAAHAEGLGVTVER